jgi:hypothetical protein
LEGIAWSGAFTLERAQALTKARVRHAPGCSMFGDICFRQKVLLL